MRKQINIYIDGTDYSQDIGPLVKAFYGDADIKTIFIGKLYNLNPLSDDKIKRSHGQIEEPEIVGRIEFRLNENIILIYAEVYDKTESATDKFADLGDKTYKNTGIPDRRMYRNHLHRALYDVLHRLTGQTLPWGTLTGVRPTKQMLDMKCSDIPDDEIIDYYKKEYLVTDKKAHLALKVAKNEIALLKGLTFSDTYSLYVGVPFCPSICLYCSFSSYPLSKYGELREAYVNALLKELNETAHIMKNKKLISIYFGGGTPTTLEPTHLALIIDKIKECFDLQYLREWTVEAGRPDSITEEKLQVLLNKGITRISINPQSMQQKTLDIIGRRHTVADVTDKFELARKLGFDNINMDLIAGLNGETIEDFRDTLTKIGDLNPDSVTVHTLCIKRAARLKTEIDEYRDNLSHETSLMTDAAETFMEEKGFLPYYLYRQKNMSDNLENVGYAKPGKEGLYNVLIMEECHTIAACGAGAASKLVRSDEVFGSGFMNDIYDNVSEKYNVRKIERAENVKSVTDYISRIEEMIERKKKLFEGI